MLRLLDWWLRIVTAINLLDFFKNLKVSEMFLLALVSFVMSTDFTHRKAGFSYESKNKH